MFKQLNGQCVTFLLMQQYLWSRCDLLLMLGWSICDLFVYGMMVKTHWNRCCMIMIISMDMILDKEMEGCCKCDVSAFIHVWK